MKTIIKKQFKNKNKEAKEFLIKNGKYNKDGELVLNEGVRTTLVINEPIRETYMCSNINNYDMNISDYEKLQYNKTSSELVTKC